MISNAIAEIIDTELIPDATIDVALVLAGDGD
jgi:hypothetical protein